MKEDTEIKSKIRLIFHSFIIAVFVFSLTGMNNVLTVMAFVLNTLCSETKTVKIFNYN